MQKLIVYVSTKDKYTFEWVHFCHISNKLYEQFFSYIGCKKRDFTTYLTKWAKEDFDKKMQIVTQEDVDNLRYLINQKFQRDYEELFIMEDGENPDIRGIVRHWVALHMRLEIEEKKMREGYYGP